MASTQMFRRYLVTGRVQGVGFRWFVEREARLIGVGGWVRNRDDGAVEVLASGTQRAVGLALRQAEGRTARGPHRRGRGGGRRAVQRIRDISN